ncbi:MAG: hypothetical protein C4332_10355 [Meiothermus sp.]
MVGFPSVTGTDGELEFAPFLRDLLGQHPYFQAHPEHLWLGRTKTDPFERYVLYALVKGSGSQTVILTGHYDVVSVANYGPLAELAFDPEKLLPALIRELRESGRGEVDMLALSDLESGNFLPGRAALDMKSGLAAGLAVLERFAEDPAREGNLLFVAVPDEEEASHGMRTAAADLLGVAARWGLEFKAAINLDASVDSGSGEEGQAVFTGSVGKLLPSVLLLGRPTHAGAPFDGVNANLLAAELTRLMEVNPDLGDPGDDPAHQQRAEPHQQRAEPHQQRAELAPPPISLYQSDLRAHYDVTTPASAWCAFNLLTHCRSPKEVLGMMVGTVEQAIAKALELMQERARVYAERSGFPARVPAYQPKVLTFAGLKRLAFQKPGVRARYDELSQHLAQDSSLDLVTLSRKLIEFLVHQAALEGPAAVVGFASLYYPKAELGDGVGARALLETVQEALTEVSQETGCEVSLRRFFPGISDISFLAGRDDIEALQRLTDNTPAWGVRLEFDYSLASRLNLPTLNIGPWGRDYHQRTERVHMPYSFGVLPELLWRVVRKAMS